MIHFQNTFRLLHIISKEIITFSNKSVICIVARESVVELMRISPR